MNAKQAQLLEKEIDNMSLEIGFMKLSENAIIPTKAHATDSGFDLYAAEEVVIKPGETKIIKTNIAVVLPVNCEAQVRPRSGVSSKTKLRVQLGTIDNAYRGDIGIIVDNISQEKDEPWITTYTLVSGETIEHPRKGYEYVSTFPVGAYKICIGDKLAQLVVQTLPNVEGKEIFHLDETDRGEKGFGSSGVRA